MATIKRFLRENFPLKEGALLQSLYFWGLLFFIVGLLSQDYQKIPLTGGFVWVTLMCLFSADFKTKIRRLYQRKALFFLLIFYVLHWVTMLVTDNMHEASRNMSLKTGLLLLTFSLGTVEEPVNKIQKKILLSTFIYGLGIVCLIDLAYAFFRYLDTGSVSHFFYDQLPQVLKRKQHYMGWYLSTGIVVILWRLFGGHQFIRKSTRWLHISLALLFFIVILLLSTRAQILGLVFMFILGGLIYSYQKKKLLRGVLGLMNIIILLGAALYIVPKTRERIVETYDEWKEWKYGEGKKDTNVRVFIWKYGFEVFAENLILGTGPGDANDELHEKFEKCKELFWGGDHNFLLTDKNYNYHNQFLQSAASMGVLGVLLLVLVFVWPFLYHRKNSILLLFVTISFFGFFTESMLERQAGLLFFAFMYPFLYTTGGLTPEHKPALHE